MLPMGGQFFYIFAKQKILTEAKKSILAIKELVKTPYSLNIK